MNTDGHGSPARPSPRRISLRAKSYLAYAVLTAYAIFLLVFILHQRGLLLTEFDELQRAYDAESQLREVDMTVLQAIETQALSINSIDLAHGAPHVREHLGLLQEAYNETIVKHADLGPEVTELGSALGAAYHAQTHENLALLQEKLSGLKARLERRLESDRQYRNELIRDFRLGSDSVVMTVLMLSLLGLTLLGAINALFFTRLTHDLQTLKKRADEMLKAPRADPIPVTRKDEVGQLSESINRMASELEEREKALELERQKYFHQEKMAAIGTLAAGIAHEVGNPIAAISALVQESVQAKIAGKCPYLEDDDLCKLEMVLGHAERLRTITQEISRFARPRLDERQLLDLNSLIRATCRLMRYDARWKNIEVQLDLDSNLPAINAVGDQLTQVIMNLLVNSADALEGLEERTRIITISTVPAEGGIYLMVRDNGRGMEKDALTHAFEAFFTTKAPDRGTGLGLSLCDSIVRGHGGQIEIKSTPNVGTTIKVFLPLGDEEDA